MPTIPEILIAAREAKGWTRYRLSQVSGVDRATLGRIESGHNIPTLQTARALTLALGVSLAIFDPIVEAEKS